MSKFYNILDGVISLTEAYKLMEAGKPLTPEELQKLEQLADQIQDYIRVASDKISEMQKEEMQKSEAEKIDPEIRTKFNTIKMDMQKLMKHGSDIKKHLDMKKKIQNR